MSLGRVLVFLLVAVGIVFAWHYYLWARLVRDAALSPFWDRALTGLFVVFGAAIPLGFALLRFAPRRVSSPVLWGVYVWMGLAFVTLFVLLPSDLVRVAMLAVRPPDPERRLFLGRAFAAVVGMLGAGLTASGMASALGRVGVLRVRVPLKKLPRALHGYTIAQITDVHVGPTIGRAFIEEIVATVNALEPDLIAITGDLVDGPVSELGELVRPLQDLKAKHGVFFVTGNHEYYSGVDEWLAFLRTLGVRVLRNERVALAEGLDLAGVDDTSAKNFGGDHGQDVKKALAGRDLARAVVLLAHQPKAVVDAALHEVDLQLSGHTHGGQIWPWGYFVRLDQPHVAGLQDHDRTKIYVSRGTGYWGPPVRLGAPAEVTRIELVADEA